MKLVFLSALKGPRAGSPDQNPNMLFIPRDIIVVYCQRESQLAPGRGSSGTHPAEPSPAPGRSEPPVNPRQGWALPAVWHPQSRGHCPSLHTRNVGFWGRWVPCLLGTAPKAPVFVCLLSVPSPWRLPGTPGWGEQPWAPDLAPACSQSTQNLILCFWNNSGRSGKSQSNRKQFLKLKSFWI